MTDIHQARCDCQTVAIEMIGKPKVHGYCHCDDCRELLQIPYHSVLAFNADQVSITSGQDNVIEFQHPNKKMTRVFCKRCGEILYNTNAMGWKIVSQLLFLKCNNNTLPAEFEANKHFFYDHRIIEIADDLPKR